MHPRRECPRIPNTQFRSESAPRMLAAGSSRLEVAGHHVTTEAIRGSTAARLLGLDE
jgi:hypothetical protein